MNTVEDKKESEAWENQNENVAGLSNNEESEKIEKQSSKDERNMEEQSSKEDSTKISKAGNVKNTGEQSSREESDKKLGGQSMQQAEGNKKQKGKRPNTAMQSFR